MDIQIIHQDLYEELLKQCRINPLLRIRPRKSNRGNKLREKGYWFLGDDQYLAIGFWKGIDWKSKIPNISFHVNNKGEANLLISASDSLEKTKFLKERIIPHFTKEGYSAFRKEYLYQNYIEALRSFLIEDWPIINDEIEKYNKFYEEELPFGLIDEYEFRKDLSNIKRYNKDFIKIKEERQQKIHYKFSNIYIKKFGPIENLEIANIPSTAQWIFFTGENGSGKTSILRAIAIGLMLNNDDGKIKESNFELRLTLKKNQQDYIFYLNENSFEKEKSFIPEGFAGYGPNRLLNDSDILNDDFIQINYQAFGNKLAHGLFHPIDILQSLSSPYDLRARPKYTEMELQTFLENLNEIIPNTAVSYNDELKLIFFDEWDKDFSEANSKSFSELSSGTKSFCGLIIDLLLKFRRQQPHIEDPAKYKGIVIIDEIDLHLHPEMQKKMVEQLSETFPDVQFLVSTHSPIPLLGAPKNSIIFSVHRTEGYGVSVDRLDDIDFTQLLPNTLLTSPIFGMQNILPNSRESIEKVRPEQSWREIEINDKVQVELNEIYKRLKSNEKN